MGAISRVSVVTASLMVAGSAYAQCDGGLADHGPIGVHGFPETYIDTDGLALAQCIDTNDPLCLPDPADPAFGQVLDVDAGVFWGESFYFLSTAEMDTSAGSAILVMAVEAVFGGPDEEILQGDQTVFNRLRLRIDSCQVGTYTVTHPYGVDTFEVTDPGDCRRVVNFTHDCLHTVNPDGVIVPTCGAGVGNFFTTPLAPDAGVGPTFLTWDPISEAPAGYVGDPAVPHAITGSPCGTNFFRVEGPGINPDGSNMIETTDFIVMGKIADIAPAPTCAGDVNGDNMTDVDDLLTLILAWGSADASADLTGNGVVDVDDLLALILDWGCVV